MATDRDRVFISYRRQDSMTLAGFLTMSLQTLLGRERVFQDVTMDPGTVFPARLRHELDRARIVLVLIGDAWLRAHDQYFRRRIDDPNDWVRQEIVAALGSEAEVWPVTIDETRVPPAEGLPTALQGLAKRQRTVIRNDHWPDDIDLLANKILKQTGWRPPRLPAAGVWASLNPAVAAQPDSTGTVVVFGHPLIVTNEYQSRSELAQQVTAIEPPGLAVVSGIGGVGKTQLVAKYFSDHATEYDFACWIDMSDREGRTGFDEIAKGLGLSGEGVEPSEMAHNHIKGSQDRWLIVFDNAKTPDQVRRLWPQGPNVKAIVTSSSRHWQQLGSVIEVPRFDEASAVAFLRARAGAGYNDDPGATALVQDLGYLPLAIGLAGAHCAYLGDSFVEYRRRLVENPLVVLAAGSRADYAKLVATLWADSLAEAERNVPGCTAVCQLLAVIDWTSVNRGWLAERLRTAAIDGIPVEHIDEILAELRSVSLLEFEDGRVAIAHPLLADGIVRSADKLKLVAAVTALLTHCMPEPSPAIASVRQTSEPLRHLQELVRIHPDLVSEELLPTLRTAADQLNLQGSVSPTFHQAVVDLHDEVLPRDDPAQLQARARLATFEQQAGHLEEATALREQILADIEDRLGKDHPDTLEARANLAASYYEIGRLEEAVALEHEVFHRRLADLGSDDPKTIAAQANYATYINAVGRHDDAVTLQQQVVANREDSPGKDHPDTLRSQNNLAIFLDEAGRLEESIAMKEYVVAKAQSLLGEDHPNTLRALAALAVSYYNAGRLDDAIAVEKTVLEDLRKLFQFEPRHPDILQAQANLAMSYWNADRRAEAVAEMEQAYEGRLAALGQEHPGSEDCRQVLQSWYRRLGRDADADALE